MYKLGVPGLLLCCAILSAAGASPLVGDGVTAYQEGTAPSEYTRTRTVRKASPYPHFHHYHHHRPHFGGFEDGEFVGGPGGFGGGPGGFGGGPGGFGGGPVGFNRGPGGFGGGPGGFGGGPGGFGGGSSAANAASFSGSIDTPFGDVSYSASNANSFSGGGGFSG